MISLIQIHTCHHYPPANQEPAKTSLARFIWPDDYSSHYDRLLLGNGASELIDLVTRSSPLGTMKPGPWDVQVNLKYHQVVFLLLKSQLASKSIKTLTFAFSFSTRNMKGQQKPMEESFFNLKMIHPPTLLVQLILVIQLVITKTLQI